MKKSADEPERQMSFDFSLELSRPIATVVYLDIDRSNRKLELEKTRTAFADLVREAQQLTW